jgi:hypothetical protein
MRTKSNFRWVRHLQGLFTALCIILLASTAEAYTVVLRSGRTIEIPDKFTITSSALIYETAPGIQVSLQLATVDISMTEQMNGEKPGSFFSRFQSAPAPPPTAKRQNTTARRTVTNRDLERFARTRKANEIAYERRRKELGLPSVEESRQRAVVDDVAMRERFEQDQLDQKDSEKYWRGQALALRGDIAASDAEIDTVRQQLDSLPAPNSFSSVFGTGVSPFFPLSPFGNTVINPLLQAPIGRRGVYVSPNRGTHVRGRVGPVTFGSPYGNRYGYRQRYARSPFSVYSPYSPYPQYGNFGYGYDSYDPSYERAELASRLNDLVARRAALQARWRLLEDEARRAGAMPGWLRP